MLQKKTQNEQKELCVQTEMSHVHRKRKLETDDDTITTTATSTAGVGGAQPPVAPLPAPFMLNAVGCLSVVFGFLSFSDIAHCAAVCVDWRRQLYEKIACLHKTLSKSSTKHVSFVNLMQSCAWKHIDSVEMYSVSTPEELYVLRQMPNLTSLTQLHMSSHRMSTETFFFPAKLKTCDVTFSVYIGTIAQRMNKINELIRDLACYARLLETLRIRLCFMNLDSEMDHINTHLDFLPLLKLHHLTELSISFKSIVMPLRTPRNESLAQAIHLHPSIETLSIGVVFDDNTIIDIDWFEFVAARPPPKLKHWNMSSINADDKKIRALQCMTTLETFTPYSISAKSFDFMRSFPRCTTLRASVFDCMTIDAFCTGLSSLHQLTDLGMHHPDLTSEKIKQILTHLPSLKRLGLFDCEMTTIDVFPEHSRITYLNLTACGNHCNAFDIAALRKLTRLTTLHMQYNQPFVSDAKIKAWMREPATLVPSLRKLTVV